MKYVTSYYLHNFRFFYYPLVLCHQVSPSVLTLTNICFPVILDSLHFIVVAVLSLLSSCLRYNSCSFVLDGCFSVVTPRNLILIFHQLLRNHGNYVRPSAM